MSQVITTLNKKGDRTIEIYPNIVSDNIPSDAVTTTKIANASITTQKLDDGAVTETKIYDASVTRNKLSYKCVNEDKIDDGAVTNSKIADGSITPDKFDTGEIYKYLCQYQLDLGDADLSAYDVSGGLVCLEIKDVSNTQSDNETLLDSLMKLGFNYNKGGYFTDGSSNVFAILIANLEYNASVLCLHLYGFGSSGLKNVYIPISTLYNVNTDFNYISNI